MKRLTERLSDGTVVLVNSEDYYNRAVVYDMKERLAAFEDFGYTPETLAKILELVMSLCDNL